MMSRGRKKDKEVALFRSTRFERAQHINDMQSRTFNNQLEVMEQNIRKKLKVRITKCNLVTISKCKLCLNCITQFFSKNIVFCGPGYLATKLPQKKHRLDYLFFCLKCAKNVNGFSTLCVCQSYVFYIKLILLQSFLRACVENLDLTQHLPTSVVFILD